MSLQRQSTVEQLAVRREMFKLRIAQGRQGCITGLLSFDLLTQMRSTELPKTQAGGQTNKQDRQQKQQPPLAAEHRAPHESVIVVLRCLRVVRVLVLFCHENFYLCRISCHCRQLGDGGLFHAEAGRCRP